MVYTRASASACAANLDWEARGRGQMILQALRADHSDLDDRGAEYAASGTRCDILTRRLWPCHLVSSAHCLRVCACE